MSSSWRRAAARSIWRGIRRVRRADGGARPRHRPGHRRRHRRAARCRHPAGHALQDHQQGHATARPLGTAGRHARRHRRDLRLRLPRLRLLRRRDGALLRGPRPPRAAGHAGGSARRLAGPNGQPVLRQEIDRRIAELREAIEKEPYAFDRRFLFRVLSMGHSQFAEFIGARGPNTQINAACASTTQAVALAEDWIRAGRCRRVIVISADDITSDHLIEWFGAGFLASGAAATDDVGRRGRHSVRPPAARHDHGDGRRGAGGGERGSRRRARHPADLRSAERGHRQQRVPRHAPGCRAHPAA